MKLLLNLQLLLLSMSLCVTSLSIRSGTQNRLPKPLRSASTTAAWIVTTAAGGCIGTPVVVKATKSWYKKINLPPWTPPDAIFAPVWTTLYSLLGFSASRIFAKSPASPFLKLYLAHYLVNISWAFVFFKMKNLRLALKMNFFLLATLVMIGTGFYRIDALAGLCFVPYAAWLSFATILNVAICRLNPTDESGFNMAKQQAELLHVSKLEKEKTKR